LTFYRVEGTFDANFIFVLKSISGCILMKPVPSSFCNDDRGRGILVLKLHHCFPSFPFKKRILQISGKWIVLSFVWDVEGNNIVAGVKDTKDLALFR
jgi:hypothetical protein